MSAPCTKALLIRQPREKPGSGGDAHRIRFCFSTQVGLRQTRRCDSQRQTMLQAPREALNVDTYTCHTTLRRPRRSTASTPLPVELMRLAHLAMVGQASGTIRGFCPLFGCHQCQCCACQNVEIYCTMFRHTPLATCGNSGWCKKRHRRTSHVLDKKVEVANSLAATDSGK